MRWLRKKRAMYKLKIGDLREIGPLSGTQDHYGLFRCVDIKEGREVGSPEPVYYFQYVEDPRLKWQLRESFLADWTREPTKGRTK